MGLVVLPDLRSNGSAVEAMLTVEGKGSKFRFSGEKIFLGTHTHTHTRQTQLQNSCRRPRPPSEGHAGRAAGGSGRRGSACFRMSGLLELYLTAPPARLPAAAAG